MSWCTYTVWWGVDYVHWFHLVYWTDTWQEFCSIHWYGHYHSPLPNNTCFTALIFPAFIPTKYSAKTMFSKNRKKLLVDVKATFVRAAVIISHDLLLPIRFTLTLTLSTSFLRILFHLLLLSLHVRRHLNTTSKWTVFEVKDISGKLFYIIRMLHCGILGALRKRQNVLQPDVCGCYCSHPV